ncbi:nitrite reductase [Candidatus Methylomirabilis lanthanidiphila]|uniref:Nitrite reductase n=1 Tax=Candidatus Methylomirabilis lanthanidiphila TaxID=2211376 RepID=A0A564ZJZ0_9BACT|nr:nitrite/sulfite reductase [Candidatus Methylomirabilis lanthanidiphila]VUZ85659.1 nitrite reductase [Candidatus Methylomirabilis lanthanidiphila]
MNKMNELDTTEQPLNASASAEKRISQQKIESANGSSWANKEDIDTFDQFVQRFWKGEIAPDEFKRFRLQNGIYGQRQEGEQMFRIKIPWGGLSAAQLELLAELSAKAPNGVAHITTRQNIQLHFIKLEQVTELMRSLASVGLTTREACGNTVRNVVVGHCAGVCHRELFDVTPYAETVARFLLRNPMNQNLPRKFKIAFSGCPEDLGLSPMQDIGACAVLRSAAGREERGFQLYVGGGLGPIPRLADLLEEFTPADRLLPTVAAIVRVFDRLGNRDDRHKARMKFVLNKLGVEAFRTLVFQERTGLESTMAGQFPPLIIREKVPTQRASSVSAGSSREPDDPAYRRWRATNVVTQKQDGYTMVSIRLELGDITSAQLRTLGFVAREFGDGTVRTTNQQNFALRWIPSERLPAVYRVLGAVGLAAPSAERSADVTACPGADTCQLGITSSRGLGAAVGALFDDELKDLADETGIRIKISACPNSCGQHHLADIGLYGGAKKFNGRQVPTYEMLLGATLTPGQASYARPVARIPAKNAPGAVEAVLRLYQKERQAGEPFNSFLDRVGLESVQTVLAPFTDLPPVSEASNQYLDYNAEEAFSVHVGPGECAS